MAGYRAVCRAEEIAPGATRLFEIDGKAIALFNVDGTLHAMEDTCLHAGGPLHEGVLQGSIITCPWHGWEFDVTSGRCPFNPKVALSRYGVRVRRGMVEIRVS
jgi:nitrite reductase (NADH) small subunit